MYVTRCFWVEKKFLVTFAIFAKFEAFSRPFSACSCSKSRILLNLLFYFIFRVFVTRCFQVARKILVNFAIFAGFSGPFLAYSLSNSRIFLNWLFLQLLWYLQVTGLTTFSGEPFLLRKLRKEFASQFLFTRSFLGISQLLWKFTYSTGTKLSYLL